MKKILIFTSVICMLLLLFTSCIASNKGTRSYTEWAETADGSITDGKRVYKKYAEIPLGIDFINGFRYVNSVKIDGTSYMIYSESMESDIKYTHYRSALTAYVAEGADTSSLDKFLSGTPDGIIVRDLDIGIYVNVGKDYSDKLDSLEKEPLTVEVRKLYDKERYNLQYLDATGTLTYAHGGIFEYKNALYYVNYDNLANNYFDSYGDFSYGRGSVTLYPLGEEMSKALESKMLTASIEYDTEYVYEHSIYNEESDSDIPVIRRARRRIATTLTILGILIPAVPLAYGLFVLISKKKKVYGYTLIASSSVWIICGIILLIISMI